GFGVKSLALFGSVARDEAGPESDVDVLVEFDGPPTFDQYIGLKLYLEDLLGAHVDLPVCGRSGHGSGRPSSERRSVSRDWRLYLEDIPTRQYADPHAARSWRARGPPGIILTDTGTRRGDAATGGQFGPRRARDVWTTKGAKRARKARKGEGGMYRRRFERLVQRAVRQIPSPLRAMMDNVAIVVEAEPSPEQLAETGLPPGETLLGLYQGVPLTERVASQAFLLPDKITIFQRPIEEMGRSDQEIIWHIRRTVIHEVAHHFGIDDARLRELRWG
ncbi:MAG: metallopeptidase family protein, partial [Chloroflexi bacterium]|nr:metallopeptidase family protein [Chloroflexota bacterium]